MVMLASDTPVRTVEQLLALPEDGMRHELLRGEHVVTPSPRLAHQEVLAALLVALWPFARTQKRFRVLCAPTDTRLDADTLVQPDLLVVRIDPKNPPQELADLAVPELVIEILSSGTADRDRGKKREIYQQAGVNEYWIVDIDSRIIERWRPDDERPEILRRTIEWQPDEDGDVLTIDLAEVFGD